MFKTDMVPLVSFLAALRILTEAQTCNNGLGKLVYEKISDYKLSAGFSGGRQRVELITRSEQPVKVLEECVRRCQKDQTTAITHCLSFDFMPGRLRGATASTPPDFKQSVCYLYYDRSQPDGAESLVRQNNAWHYNEVCLSSGKLQSECPNRLYVFDRTPGYRFESAGDKEVIASNRTECEDKCLNEILFACRSASYNRQRQTCRLSSETRYMNPRGFRQDLQSDYMENLCLPTGSQMCTTTALILESGKELDGAFEREVVPVRDLTECSNYCTRSLTERGLFCRSFLYEDKLRLCTLYDEDPLDFTEGGESVSKPLKPSSGDLYRVLCGASEKDRSHNTAHGSSHHHHTWSPPYGQTLPPYPPSFHQPSYHPGHPPISQNFIDGPYPQRRDGFSGGGWGPPIATQPPYGGYGAGYVGGGYGGSGGYDPGWRGSGGYVGTPSHRSFNYPPWGGGWSDLYAAKFGIHGRTASPSNLPVPSSTGYGGSGSYIGGSSSGWTPPYNTPFGPPHPPFPPGGYGERCRPSIAAFRRVGYGTRLRSFYIRRALRVERLDDCEAACAEARDIQCRSFNYRVASPSGSSTTSAGSSPPATLRSQLATSYSSENCELSDFDSRQLQLSNPSHFDPNTNFDYFERDDLGTGGGGDCLDVSQSCTPDGMEFTLRTVEGFYGRIYTYGFYDSCFYDGNGGSVNVLRISRANGFPRCGTQQYGDVMTNIVVVQFNDYVQTSRDKKYNLTCFLSGPGEAVVTSNYLDTRVEGPSSKSFRRYPTQIEHLPAQNILTSNVQLRILYRGTPTTTIAVGDLLTFRLEARGKYQFDFYNDIFATNVIAKDPYSGRQVHLIDSRGCPVDLYVFPELHKAPDGALEAEFYAFKIPDSNLLVFQATVRTCRGPCEPAICTDRGRPGTFPSWGRRKRDTNNTISIVDVNITHPEAFPPTQTEAMNLTTTEVPHESTTAIPSTDAEEVHELLTVYLSRSDIPKANTKNREKQQPVAAAMHKRPTVCVAQAGYYAIMTLLIFLVFTLMAVIFGSTLIVKRVRMQAKLAGVTGVSSPFFGPSNSTIVDETPVASSSAVNGKQYHLAPKTRLTPARVVDDMTEPIYTDPSLFEVSRSLTNLADQSVSSSKH
ncbi:uncharacterized protein LOC111264099 isoform X3 [Varroa jacobsoni]|uniref:Uncharacterized protein n=1 Tax=Varroa destructor TaxID=109461 RepID=A0A7M7J3E3_VARDE|nr:uncharacterized protein LOC111244033 isoform X3 [Varroa destructor]XP_022695440.1 uncharacterized protein LOC111264099 isoform X3 [Varroa jacobsoni]